MPNNASTNYGSASLVLEAIHTYLTTLRFTHVPFRSKSGTCPATRRLLPGYGAKRLADGQRDDGLTRNGRLTARRERIFYGFSNFLMLWKEESLLLKSSFIFIYEICSQVRVLSCSLFFPYSEQIQKLS